jgi:predicted metal-binding protein
MEKYARYIKKAKKLGAKDARVILARSVVTAEWVRLKSRFGCGGYAQALTCPPYSPKPEETRKMLKEYKRALLIRGDQYADIREIVTALEREAFLDGYWKAFAMASGPCEYCKTCGEHCRYPRKARPSMEACGIDVFTTVRANGFPIEVVKSRSCKANYYGLLLLE